MDIETSPDTSETQEDLKNINEDSKNDNRREDKVLTECNPDCVLSDIVKKDPDEEDSYEMLDVEYGGQKLPQMIKVRREAKSVCNICGHKTKGAINTAR